MISAFTAHHPWRVSIFCRNATRRRLTWLVAAVVWVFATEAICGREIHVAPTGNDAGAGSEAEPFREIRRALSVVRPGDEIIVADGRYLGFDMVRLRGFTLRAPGRKALIMPTSDRGKGSPFNMLIWECSDVVIDGMQTFKAETAGMRLVQCHKTTVRNGVFGNNGKWGIVTSHCTDLLLEDNDCYGSKMEHGIYVANSGDNPTVRGNRLHDNAGSGLRSNGDVTEGGDGIISGAVFENNVIYNNGSNAANRGAAINLDGLQDGIIRNNLLYANQGSGIALFKGGGAAGPKGMQILHNTIIMPADGRYNLRITDAIGPILVRNNIFYSDNKSRGFIFWDTSTDVSHTDSDYNVFGGARHVAPDAKKPRVYVPDWIKQGHETHSIASSTLNSLFVDYENGDYHLDPISPAVDRGEPLPSVKRDIEGTARPQGTAPDAGAYELVP